MGHGSKMMEAFEKLTQLIGSYDIFQKDEPNFTPDRANTWKVIPTAEKITNSLGFIISSEKQNKYWKNTVELASIFHDEVIYQSTPNSFMYAYRELVGIKLDVSDLWQIKELGANILPLDPSVRYRPPKHAHSVFRTSMQGFRYYPKGGGDNIIRAGTAQGQYKDKAQLETIFYDTALNVKSLIQCRFIEFLSEALFENSDSG
jgi:hypothetical protein